VTLHNPESRKGLPSNGILGYDARMTQTGQSLAGAAPGLDTRVADAVRIVLVSLAIGVLARISVLIGPVPITGQTLGVLAAGIVLGPRRGALAVLLYLAQGASGAPVFAGGTFGFAVLAGPTAGYLIGFVPAAFVVGALAERLSKKSVWQMSLALSLGTAIVYLCGAAWLSRFVGWDRTVALGITPFVLGDALKIGIVALAAPAIASFGSRSRSRR